MTLNVKNDFNSLQRPLIDAGLRRKKTLEYLVRIIRAWRTDRQQLVGHGGNCKPITCEVPQGSALIPTLWNAVYDDLLNINVPTGVKLIGFADDLAVIGAEHNGQLLQHLMNPVLSDIDRWMVTRGLALAHNKSEAIMLTKKLRYVQPSLKIGGQTITIRKSLRYLGVILYTRMTYGEHVNKMASKAATSSATPGKLMPNLKGPQQPKRRLLCSVVESQLQDAALVWASTVENKTKHKRTLLIPQRHHAHGHQSIQDGVNSLFLVIYCTMVMGIGMIISGVFILKKNPNARAVVA